MIAAATAEGGRWTCPPSPANHCPRVATATGSYLSVIPLSHKGFGEAGRWLFFAPRPPYVPAEGGHVHRPPSTRPATDPRRNHA